MRSKQKSWFLIALAGSMLLAPSSILIKVLGPSYDPFFLNAMRFSIAACVALPWTIKLLPLLRAKAAKAMLEACLFLTVSATTMVLAVTHGPASYAATIQLLAPLLLVWYSKRLTGEKIARKTAVGLAFAAVGAACITLMPIALHQRGTFEFYPLATLFGLLNVIFYPLATVEYRRVHENFKLPLLGLFGFSAICIASVNWLLWIVIGETRLPVVTTPDVMIFVYLGVYVSFLSKILSTLVYEKNGSAITAIISYFGSLLAILLPIFILKETLSLEVALGGCLILLGLALTELREPKHHKHRHIFHNH